MKTLIAALLISLPSMSSAAEYLKVECYLAEGTTVTKTFDGYLYGNVALRIDRVIVEGKTIAANYIHRRGTPSTCRAPSEATSDSDGWRTSYDVKNVYILEFDFGYVSLNCAPGSVVKRYGNLANFTKALETTFRQSAQIGVLPYCLDVSNLE